jgi:hypothetical protein
MIVHTMHSKLPDAKAEDFFGFMVNAPQDIYAKWLPDEHHEFHLIRIDHLDGVLFTDKEIKKT